MIKAWKKWRSSLTYPKKIALNLLLTAGLLFSLWAYKDYPLPTTEMEFRRMERQGMLPKSEIVFISTREDDVFTSVDGVDLVIGDRWVVGRHGANVVMANVGRQKPWRIGSSDIDHPLNESGPTLVPLNYPHIGIGSYGYWVEETYEPGHRNYDYHYFTPFLLLDTPPETARAELTATDHDGNTKTGGGWDLGDGIWILGLETKSYYDTYYQGSEYILRLYDAQENLLLEQTGTVRDIWTWENRGNQ